MNKEKERLLDLLHQNKITETDYKLLLEALDKNSRIQKVFNFLINPFQKIAGIYALIMGISIILIMSYLANNISIHFPGLLSYIYTRPANGMIKVTPITYLIIVSQNLISCLTLSIALFISAKILRQNGLRFIDFIGTIMLSRFSYFTVTVIFYIIYQINSTILDSSDQSIYTIDKIFVMLIVFSGLIWQIILFFNAYKESSGLTGNKLWRSFIVTLLISQLLSAFVINFVL